MIEQFQWAIKTGDLESVKGYIVQNADYVSIPDKSVRRATPMHLAADFGQDDVLKFLISKGGNVNSPDAFGITPLLAAVYEGHISTVRLLLENGADKNVKGADGKSPIESTDNKEIQKLFE